MIRVKTQKGEEFMKNKMIIGMKRRINLKSGLKFMSVTVLSLGIALSSFSMADTTTYGAAGAAADTSFTIEEMLMYAIQDEYLAKAEYEAIMDTFGVINPFSNIAKSEQTHINLLTPLFETYDVAMPQDTASDYTAVPATLAETFAIGVDAEVKNIAMYESFLATDLPDDIRLVFERLKNASESHLKAFENGLDRPTQSIGNSNSGRGNSANNSQSSSVNNNGRFGFQNSNRNTSSSINSSFGNINRY